MLPARIAAGIFSLLSAVGVLLAAMGIFGAVQLDFVRRRRDFAIRSALGASPQALTFLLLKGVGLAVLLGLAMGVGIVAVLGQGWSALLATNIPSATPLFALVNFALISLIALTSCAPIAFRVITMSSIPERMHAE